MILPKRRGFLLGAGALLMAPAIVRASSLMPVSVPKWDAPMLIDGMPVNLTEDGYSTRLVHFHGDVFCVASVRFIGDGGQSDAVYKTDDMGATWQLVSSITTHGQT